MAFEASDANLNMTRFTMGSFTNRAREFQSWIVSYHVTLLLSVNKKR